MSTRIDVVLDSQRVANAGGDAVAWFNENATEDCAFYAPSIGIDVRGRDAAGTAVRDLIAQHHPQYHQKGEPVELGNFVVTLLDVEVEGRSVVTCQLWRFEGDKLAGFWAVNDHS
jgi:hypothetical protein